VLDPDDFALHISIDRSDEAVDKCDSLEGGSSPFIDDDENDRVMISGNYYQIPQDPLEDLNGLINNLPKPKEKFFFEESKTEAIRRSIYNPEPVIRTIIDQDKRVLLETVMFKSGDSYKGQWLNGGRDGLGTQLWDGNSYYHVNLVGNKIIRVNGKMMNSMAWGNWGSLMKIFIRGTGIEIWPMGEALTFLPMALCSLATGKITCSAGMEWSSGEMAQSMRVIG
jgi:hypothetical protein